MIRPLTLLAACGASLCTAPAAARMSLPSRAEVEAALAPAPRPYLECVPYARQVSGIEIYGDAHTWWGQAEGRYARGFRPQVGAVLAFKPSGNSALGHVAAVSRIVDRRTILVRHANWSPINGRRGQIEDNVRVVDVSPDNDWSVVRVWYAPLQALGTAHWPIAGFIYPARSDSSARLARAEPRGPTGGAGDSIAAIIQHKMRW